MARVLSGLQPSGILHIGNYFGALTQWVAAQEEHDAFYTIADLHALTLEIDPAELRERTFDTAVTLLAAGLDPKRCTLFVQGHVHQHNEMAWILECVASYGELHRMTQFKDKSAGQESVRVGLLTYPVLMAADVLLYQANQVPVGDDQRQHLELARNLANRFNGRYREVFTIPEAVIPAIGARVMDLQNPERKMSKSVSSPRGTINMSDTPDEIVQKIKRAVTDTDSVVAYDPKNRPGVSNLLELLSAATGGAPKVLAKEFNSYGALKEAVATALVESLAPVQSRIRELRDDETYVFAALREGAEKARAIAEETLHAARDAVGLLSPY
jgi:tryptophanyl-tRNA synthetase